MRNRFAKFLSVGISGFSLPELIVSIAIIVLITVIVVYNQGDFNDRIALSNSAGEIELQIREAQVYGVSVREKFPGSQQFQFAYGVVFNLNTGAAPYGSYTYWSFVDSITVNSQLDPTAGGSSWANCVVTTSTECRRANLLSRNNVITQLCVINSANSNQCTPQVGRMDITFLRPDPSARFSFRNSSGTQISFPNHKGGRIYVQSPKGNQMIITVLTNGQMSIQ